MIVKRFEKAYEFADDILYLIKTEGVIPHLSVELRFTQNEGLWWKCQ